MSTSEEKLKDLEAFASIWIKNGHNATQAYLETHPNCKRTTAATEGKNFLRNPHVQQYIEKIAQPTAEKRIASAIDVLVFLTAAMNGEIKDQFGLDASLSDREKAAELLGKTYSMFTDKVKVTGNINMAEVLKAARNRAKKVKEQEQEHGKE